MNITIQLIRKANKRQTCGGIVWLRSTVNDVSNTAIQIYLRPEPWHYNIDLEWTTGDLFRLQLKDFRYVLLEYNMVVVRQNLIQKCLKFG